jgi:hypothetical protein
VRAPDDTHALLLFFYENPSVTRILAVATMASPPPRSPARAVARLLLKPPRKASPRRRRPPRRRSPPRPSPLAQAWATLAQARHDGTEMGRHRFPVADGRRLYDMAFYYSRATWFRRRPEDGAMERIRGSFVFRAGRDETLLAIYPQRMRFAG